MGAGNAIPSDVYIYAFSHIKIHKIIFKLTALPITLFIFFDFVEEEKK